MNNLPAFPASDRYSVREFERTVRRYVEGASCAEAVAGTLVHPEVLRSYLKRAGLTRSRSESQRMKTRRARYRAWRLFGSGWSSSYIARYLGIDRTTVYAWRRQHEAGVHIPEWTSGKGRS